MRVLVTGATGFIGGAVVRHLAEVSGTEVIAAVRRPVASIFPDVEIRHVADLGVRTEWSTVLDDVDVVVHAAARVHVMDSSATGELEEYRETNVVGTKRLVEHCAGAGVRRFVFISSIKVNGEVTGEGAGQPLLFSADDVPAPVDDYGRSKLEAEQSLWAIADASNLEAVILRPPLVYGPGARGNFPRLVRLVKSGVPLPLASIRNKRSLVSLDNLVDCLVRCATHPAAPGNTFLVSDGHDLSTPELIQQIAVALGRSPRLWPFPPSLLRLAGRVTGRAAAVQRLTESLQADIEPTLRVLEWRPPLSVEEGMRRAVATT